MATRQFSAYQSRIIIKSGFFRGPAAHSYVLFDEGTGFECFGDKSGGRKLAGTTGRMDLGMAHKLHSAMPIALITLKHTDFPLGTQTLAKTIFGKKFSVSIDSGAAGILYLVNGVCHMASNRTIAPTKLTVNKVDGYKATCAVWGTYGTHTVFDLALADRYLDEFLKGLGITNKRLKRAFKDAVKKVVGNNIPAYLMRHVQDSANAGWRRRLKNLGIYSEDYLTNRYAVSPKMGDSNVPYDSIPLLDKIEMLYHPENLAKESDLATKEHELFLRDYIGEDQPNSMIDKLQVCRADLLSSLNDFGGSGAPGQEGMVVGSTEEDGLVSTLKIAEKMNNHFNSYMEQTQKALGTDAKFEEFHNMKPGEELLLFNPDQLEISLNQISMGIASDEGLQKKMRDFEKAVLESGWDGSEEDPNN